MGQVQVTGKDCLFTKIDVVIVSLMCWFVIYFTLILLLNMLGQFVVNKFEFVFGEAFVRACLKIDKV